VGSHFPRCVYTESRVSAYGKPRQFTRKPNLPSLINLLNLPWNIAPFSRYDLENIHSEGDIRIDLQRAFAIQFLPLFG
jgi:hypothetical protein